jgi:Derlin-2/3
LIAPFVNVMFFSQAYMLMMIYVWSKHNAHFVLNFMDVFVFQAPHVPWVMLGLSALFGSSIMYDLLGIAVGHLYYFLNDVFPTLPGGFPLLITPSFL